VADLLSSARVLCAAIVALSALAGFGPVAATALVIGGLTDVLDGRLARRGRSSSWGPHVDAAADIALLSCTAAALEMLQPGIAAANAAWLAAVSGVFVASLAASWLSSRRLVDPRQLTGKIAGGLLYLFAVMTLLFGAYSRPLLAAALAMLAVSSVEAILKATIAIHASGTASAARSHAPHIANGVNRSPNAITSRPSSTDSATRDTAP
jgi:phosphatidylglycerophosphate synthase